MPRQRPQKPKPYGAPEAIPFRRPPRPGTKPAARPALEPQATSVPAPTWVEPQWLKQRHLEHTDALRLASSAIAWLESYGTDLVLSWKTEAARNALLEEIPHRLTGLGLSAPTRIFGRHLAREAQLRLPPTLLSGDATLPVETEAREAGLRYGIDFSAGYSVGLFIDQRINRASLVQALQSFSGATPAKVLNTFAYTCSFSVVAAHHGAQTLSVDLSKKSLQRGEQNFKRNGIETGTHHRFIADDVFGVLPRLAKRGERFNFIILDPPTFSRNHSGDAFQAEEDYSRLIQLAVEVAAPGAQILLSTNCTTLRPVDLQQMARQVLKQANRTGRFWANPPPQDIPVNQAARTIWVEVT